MWSMFYVRSARALPPPSLESVPPRAHTACVPATQRPLAPPGPYILLPVPHARLFTRQGASAFNQPLSFDTSKVTTMYAMFYVRSARALPPPALSRALPVHAACVAATQRPRASRAAPLPASHARLGSPRRRSTSRSASTRPRSRPWPACSKCAPRMPCPPHESNTLTPPLPSPAPHARLSTRQRATTFNLQLSFDTSSVTTMERMFQVRSARALALEYALCP